MSVHRDGSGRQGPFGRKPGRRSRGPRTGPAARRQQGTGRQPGRPAPTETDAGCVLELGGGVAAGAGVISSGSVAVDPLGAASSRRHL